MELYQKDNAAKNSKKIVELFEKIIVIYFVYKNDHETAVMSQSLLEEHITQEDTEAVDDFIIDYRQNEGEEVHHIDALLPMRCWSTVD